MNFDEEMVGNILSSLNWATADEDHTPSKCRLLSFVWTDPILCQSYHRPIQNLESSSQKGRKDVITNGKKWWKIFSTTEMSYLQESLMRKSSDV